VIVAAVGACDAPDDGGAYEPNRILEDVQGQSSRDCAFS
jgi:hypothetical protein